MAGRGLSKRVEALEVMEPDIQHGMPFLWFAGQSLDDALAYAGLTLEDNISAIEITGPGGCPIHDRERGRLNPLTDVSASSLRGKLGNAE